MIRPKLLDLYSADAPGGEPGRYAPADPENCCLWLMAFVGIEGEPGHDTYQLGVCTPLWLAGEGLARGYTWGRSLLIVPRWDHGVVVRAIETLLGDLAGPDWATVAERLSRFAWAESDDVAHHRVIQDRAVLTG